MIRYIRSLTLLLFTSVFSLFSCSGDFPEEIKAREYTYESFENSIEKSVFESKEKLDLYYEGDVAEDKIEKAVKDVLKNNYFCSCLLKDIETDYEKNRNHICISLKIKYKDDINLPVYVAKNEWDIVCGLIKGWGSHTGKTTIIAKGSEYSEDELFSLMDTAEINSALLPCEAEQIMYEIYPRAGEWQIINMWLQLPIDERELLVKQEELENTAQSCAEQIAAVRDTKDRYRQAYDILVNFAEYDSSIAMLSNMQRFDIDTYINRSAYGGLVSGKTVCNGFARGYKAICDEVGLPCWVVVGTKGGEKHSWNMVIIDDKKYYIDCTFGSYDKEKTEDTFMIREDRLPELGYELSDYFFIPEGF